MDIDEDFMKFAGANSIFTRQTDHNPTEQAAAYNLAEADD